MRPETTSVVLWALAGAILSAATVVILLPRIAGSDIPYLLVIPLAVVLAFVLLRSPVRVLPTIAFTSYAIGLVQVVPTGLPLGISSIIMIVWAARRAISALGDSALRLRFPASAPPARQGLIPVVVPALAVSLIVWLLLLTVIGEFGDASAGWLRSFVPVVLLPLLVQNLVGEASVLKNAWITLGGVLGVYAIIEFALRANFLYWALGMPSSQHWSVYRSEGPFGHPLLFGTFLGTAAILAFGAWLEGRRSLYLVGAGLAVGGVLVTASRGSLLAVLLGILLAVSMVVLRPRRSRKGRAVTLALLLGATAVVLIAATPLLDRWTSDEAEGSSAARNEGIALALSLAEKTHYLGTGAGTSSTVALLSGSTLPIEVSPLQALVSMGLPGALIFATIIFVAFTRSVSGFKVSAAAGLLTFVISVSGYNYLDDRRSALLLLGAILMIALGSRPPRPRDAAPRALDERSSL
jgi:O-antigen ligase